MLGLRVYRDGQSVYSGEAGPTWGTAGRNLLGRGLYTSGFPEDGSTFFFGRPYRPLGEDPSVVVGRLGHVAFLVGRLDYVGVAGDNDDILPWPSVRLLGVLVYLVLFSRSL